MHTFLPGPGTVAKILFSRVAQDVTEAAKHDRAVAAMANELRQLIDTANAPIFGIDIHGLVNEWNDKTAEIKTREHSHMDKKTGRVITSKNSHIISYFESLNVYITIKHGRKNVL